LTDAFNHWRGNTSSGKITMIIHRRNWERSMTIEVFSKGEPLSLVRVIAPKKDRGNATLVNDRNMWTFSSKVNRIIKVPSSMMSQGWMGSDFSNKDIARTNEILDQYNHSLLNQWTENNFEVFEIQLLPYEDAPVVWGKQVLKVRSDNVLLEQNYYDQEFKLVKTMKTLEIAKMGGRSLAVRQRMSKVDKPDEWTDIVIDSMIFDINLEDSVFTLSNLRNPRL